MISIGWIGLQTISDPLLLPYLLGQLLLMSQPLLLYLYTLNILLSLCVRISKSVRGFNLFTRPNDPIAILFDRP